MTPVMIDTAQNHKIYGPDRHRRCGRCHWHSSGVSGDGSAGTQDHWCRAVTKDGEWVFDGVPVEGAKHIDELHHTQMPDTPGWCPCVSIPVTEQQVEFAEKLPPVECDKCHLRLLGQNAMLRAALSQARVALERYGCHWDEDFGLRPCQSHVNGPETCDCGLDAALKAVSEAEMS